MAEALHRLDSLAKEEKVVEEMKTVTSIETTLYNCMTCKRVSDKKCKHEGHISKSRKGKLYFFACSACNRRVKSLKPVYTKPCANNCARSRMERASAYRIKAPRIHTPTLKATGDKEIHSLRYG